GRGDDEIADLTDTLNRTAARLEQTIDALTGEREQSAAILASMDEGVVVVDSKLRVIFCNQTFLCSVGVPAADCKGRPIVELASRLDILPLFQRTLADGETIRGEVTAGFAPPRVYAVTAAPIRSGGVVAGVVCVLHDISEIRRLERARRDFAANVSHELRTPLTAIQGFAETLLDGALDDAGNARRFVQIIHEHALRLGRLTDDLLKLAQIEAGGPDLEPRPLAVDKILHSCAEAVRIGAGQKGLALIVGVPPELPLLCADARAIEEIVQNLLQNAIRYTPPGGRIRMEAAVRDGEMVLSVSDTGIGIAVEDQRRIFERFYRADAARSRESGGTGLGLAIVKHLAEFHGGRVTVESEVGRGSTFRAFLPLGCASLPPAT
ncbi:MAG: PAS domain-containing protein, partial [Acidobacteriota bacterium]|nr:PAS domain-containing protein [Acidobacteriota bacterium]